MAETRELNPTVDDTPTGIGRFLTWVARMAVVGAFLFIGVSKFNGDP